MNKCIIATCYVHKKKNTNTYVTWWHMHTDHVSPAGSDPGAESDPDTQVRRSKSLFSQVLPLLFIHEAERKRRDRKGGKQRGIPPLRGLWCGKQNLLFNLSSNGIHMTHPEPVRALCAPLSSFFFFFVCVYLFVFACTFMHRWFCDVHMCAR